MNRRGFLGALLAAPVAAPVAISEAMKSPVLASGGWIKGGVGLLQASGHSLETLKAAGASIPKNTITLTIDATGVRDSVSAEIERLTDAHRRLFPMHPLQEITDAPSIVPTAPARRFPFRMMVVGHGRHGKDTVAEILRDRYGANFVSSSWFMAERVVYPHFADKYATVQECYDDRANHRSTWFDLIAAYNGSDMSTLGRAIFAEYDLYVGNRNAREFNACRNAGVFDVSLWVDAGERVEYREPRSSLTIEPWMADYIVDNNGSPADLERNVATLMDRLLADRQTAVTQSWASAGTR